MQMIVFCILDILVVGFDLLLALNAFQKKKWNGKYLGITLLLAAGVNISYMWSILTTSYFYMSLANSIYFSCISVMLMYLVVYVIRYTQFQTRPGYKHLLYLAKIYMVFDVAVQMINPWKEISMHYISVDYGPALWIYAPKLLYRMHLIYSYLLLVYVAVLLLEKIYITPLVYRMKYFSVLIGLFCVVLLNAAFLFLFAGKMLDVSILFYIAIGFYLYWNSFHYSEEGMLNRVRQLVLDELGRPLILFDDRNILAMYNREISFLLSPECRKGEYTLTHFLEDTGFDMELLNAQQNRHFQYTYRMKEKLMVYRCDYRILRDKKQRIIGRIFVLTDKSLEIDLLTGFHSEQTFFRSFSKEMERHYPVGIAICDLNRLAKLNKMEGEAAGDKAIQILAGTMENCFPKNTYFVRLNDANLLAVCQENTLEKMRIYVEQIRNSIANCREFGQTLDIQYAINVVNSDHEDVVEAVETAMFSMKTRKLMDSNSAHSSLLDSLAQIQQESDNCTEEHIKRTRIMGEKLGMRLGLTDIELSKLTLLCLMHDIGKVGVPLEILNKPSRLNAAEWDVMRSHVEKGYRIAMASPELESIAPFILHHHECWNGSGYPDGLERESIPVLSRMIAIIDAYDAMTNDRPYRKAVSEAKAREELRQFAGIQFDPHIVSEFLQMLEEEHPLTKEELLEIETSQKVILPNGPDRIRKSVPVAKHIHGVMYSKYKLDGHCNILTIDANFESITGYSEKDIKSYHLTQWDLIYPEDLDFYQMQVGVMLEQNQEAYLEHRIRRKDASERYVFCFGKQYFDSVTRLPRIEIIVTDVSDTAAMRQMLNKNRANRNRDMSIWLEKIRQDPLTRLLNREAYKNDVEMYLLEAKYSLLFIMLDVDYFKNYNDSYGHIQGDKLLIEVAKELFVTTQGRGIAGRLGGDEFSITIFMEKESSAEKARECMMKIRNDILNVLMVLERPVTISMGATLSDESSKSFSYLYKNADRALYQSKEAGRNQCTFYVES